MPKVPLPVHWTRFESPRGRMLVASTERGLCRVLLPTEPEERFFAWLRRHFRPEDTAEDPLGARNGEAIDQINEVLAGQRGAFDLPLHLVGSEFQRAVWDALLRIPRGESRTYGEVAVLAGKPGAFQATGGAVGSNPLPLVVPCHRVLGFDGRLCGYGGGLEFKEFLLRLEGTSFKPERAAKPKRFAEPEVAANVQRPEFPERTGFLGKLKAIFA